MIPTFLGVGSSLDGPELHLYNCAAAASYGFDSVDGAVLWPAAGNLNH